MWEVHPHGAKTPPLWGVRQRRQSVRVNFPRARPRNSTIFSQVCGKRIPSNPAPQKPEACAWGTRWHKRVRRNSICGGPSCNICSLRLLFLQNPCLPSGKNHRVVLQLFNARTSPNRLVSIPPSHAPPLKGIIMVKRIIGNSLFPFQSFQRFKILPFKRI